MITKTTFPVVTEPFVAGRRVILRFDGDVPLARSGDTTVVGDAARLEAARKTVSLCLKSAASLTLVCHLGRPDGPRGDLSARHLVSELERVFDTSIEFIADVSKNIKRPPRIALLENLRFWPGEEKNSPAFARRLAGWGDVFVNDAMAVLHRRHASIVGVPNLLPGALGLHCAGELRALNRLTQSIEKPYTVVLGGAKAGDKSSLVADLTGLANVIVVGGLVALPYLKAMERPIGSHLVSDDELKVARGAIRKAHEHGCSLLVPTDVVTAEHQIKRIDELGPGDAMLDVGPKSRRLFAEAIARANTVFWNGAMGKFEIHRFCAGTLAIARAMAGSDADVKIAAGGDTLSAIHQFKLEKGFTFLSTGGGATLEYIAGRELPGLEALSS